MWFTFFLKSGANSQRKGSHTQPFPNRDLELPAAGPSRFYFRAELPATVGATVGASVRALSVAISSAS